MKWYVQLTALLLITQTSFSQLYMPYVPPSVNVSGIMKHTNIQVGHYTGTVNISIPLGAVPGKDISVPISLNYHTAGIKVQEEASSVGLGWNLNSGGAITRLVRGMPDGGSKPFCDENAIMSYYSNSFGSCDGERDLFYFSLMGRNGQLFLDANGIPHTMPYQDLVISPGVGPAGIGYWMITDEKGYRYYFGEAPSNREETTYYVGNSSSGYSEKETFISTWYLTRIISPAGVQVATFTYAQGSDYEYFYYHDLGEDPPGSPPLQVTPTNTKIKIKNAKYISSITTSIASASFTYQTTREDLPGSWSLLYVTLNNDPNGGATLRYKLDMDYFPGQFGYPYNRLRLAAIREGVTQETTAYIFNYYETTIAGGNPTTSDPNVDHYGYYNYINSSNSNRLGNKNPGGLDRRRVFSLSDITNSTGNRTSFEYESNFERGLRIKSVSNFDGTNLVSRSTFSYSGAMTIGTPIYEYTDTESGSIIMSSSSFRDLFDLSGTTVGYSTVTEMFLDNSKIVREFLNTEFPDEPPLAKKYYQTLPPINQPQDQGDISSNEPPFPPSTPRFWMRGLLREQRIYDNQNNLLKMDVITYQDVGDGTSVSNQVVIRTRLSMGDWVTYHVGKYHYRSRTMVPATVHSFSYSQENYSDHIIEKTTFAYHNIHKTFPVSVIRQVGFGPEEKISFRYPVDVAGGSTQPASPDALAAGIWSMINNHIIEPVEKISWFKDVGAPAFKVTGAELVSYRRNATLDRPLPVSTYSLPLGEPIASLSPEASLTGNGSVFSFDNRYRLLDTFTFTDPTATLSSVQGASGISTSYQWLNNTLLSSVITNPGTNQFKRDYLYNSINGVTRITDENGRNINYQYDQNFGRLQRVKDHENNIVTRYRYHIKGEPEELKNGQIIHTCAMTGTPITFTCYENTEYGQTSYYWNFGDGNSGTSTGDINYTYSDRGTYEVKLRKENPEYYSLNTGITVAVHKAITGLSGYIDGPSTYDVCSLAPPPPTLLVAYTSGDALTYAWEYSFNGGWWWSMGSGTGPVTGYITSAPPSGFGNSTVVGTWQIRCTVTDACGNAYTKEFTLINYASDPGCETH
ncbi:MAG: PKD domain-containing protein [Cyclobacteriaceae bacterium]